VLLLGVLNAQMVFHFFIHQSNLLKDFENHFSVIIFSLNNIKGFGLLLLSILSLCSLHLEDIKSHLSHLNGAELGGVWVSCLPGISVIITSVVILTLYNLFLMLIKLIVHVVKIDRCNINLIHILSEWISRSYTNVPRCQEPNVPLRFNASPKTASSAVIESQFTVDDNIFDVDKASIEVVKHARVVRIS